MKKLFPLFIALFTLASFTVSAQKGNNNKMAIKQQLKDSLHFSQQQIDSIVVVQQEFMPKIREVRQNTSIDIREKKMQITALKKQLAARLRGFLSDEEVSKLQNLEQKMRAEKKQDGTESDQ